MGAPMRVLVLAPHTDDGEMGCGGTIVKLVHEGARVMYVAFSFANRSLPKGFSPGSTRKELYSATKALGIAKRDVRCFDYEVREFPAKRQELLEALCALKEEFNPHLVFAPSVNDLHQDHKTVAEESRRMFKMKTVLGYEMPWNNIRFDAVSFSILKKEHIDGKIDALGLYKSQQHRPYMNREYVESLARVRGMQVSSPYAEAFEVVRWVMV